MPSLHISCQRSSNMDPQGNPSTDKIMKLRNPPVPSQLLVGVAYYGFGRIRDAQCAVREPKKMPSLNADTQFSFSDSLIVMANSLISALLLKLSFLVYLLVQAKCKSETHHCSNQVTQQTVIKLSTLI